MAASKATLREVYLEAAEIADVAARAAFLEEACRGDATLRTRVGQLLTAEASVGNFLREGKETTAQEYFSEKPGDWIGRYRLVERIGRGGGGVVYRAEQELPVRRFVALKILELGRDTQSFVARFEAERQALAMMDHPNIAKVLDAGATETGRPYLVMELVSGLRFSDYCERNDLSLPQRLELFIQVCHATQHAHQKGIVHRDLKPSNILVTQHEGVAVPKVIDFGIAKAMEQSHNAARGLTSVNQFLGTPAYMSPEQVAGGRDIDTRSDVYSLGVILYEVITGQPPFDAKELLNSGWDEMRRIIREVDPPKPSTTTTKKISSADSPTTRKRRNAIRGDLDWIVMKCLEKDRARRYETANGLALDIRRHLDNEPVSARPPTQFYRLQKIVRRHRLAFTAAGIITAVLVAAAIVSTAQAWRATRAEREQSRLRDVAEAKADESRQRLIRRYVAEGNSVAEHGRPILALPWLVEALELEAGDPQREAQERLRIAQIQEGAPVLLWHQPQGKSVTCVALNGDGSRLISGSDDGVVRLAELKGEGDKFRDFKLPQAIGRVGFSRDGGRLVAADVGGHAQMWDTHTGEALTPLIATANFKLARQTGVKPTASFSPDGKWLLLAGGTTAAQLRSASDGQLRREFAQREVVHHATFSPDGKYVATSCQDGTAQVWETMTGERSGATLVHTGAVAWAEFSPDGTKLLTVRDLRHVQVWDWRAGSRVTSELPRRSELSHASFSRQGDTILTAAWSGHTQLYEANTSRFLFEFELHGGVLDAAFSPNGDAIATACHDENVWIRPAFPKEADAMVLPQGSEINQIAFSGDSRRLAVGSDGYVRVWDLAPAEQGVRRLAGRVVQWVEFDPTGQRALVLSTGDRSGVAVYDVRSGQLVSQMKWKRDEMERARFSPDGRRVLASGNNRSARIFEVETGSEVFAPLTHKDRLRDAIWSPDAKHIFTAARKAGAQAWDAATGKLVRTYTYSNAIAAIAVSQDGSRFATAEEMGLVRLFETASGGLVASWSRSPARIRQVQFSPDGNRLAVASDEAEGTGVVELRDPRDGRIIGKPMVHRDQVRAFEFSRDGRWLASACEDHSARVWNGMTGEPVSPRLKEAYETYQVIFSPDGQRLATRIRRGAVRLWNAQTGEPISTPMLYARNTGDGHVAFSPDGTRLLIARGADEAILRELRPTTGTLEELRLLAEVTSVTRFEPATGMVPLDKESLNESWKRLRALRAAR